MKPIDYKLLLESYLTQSIPVEKFEKEYLDSFMAETGEIDKQLFDILEDLFEDIDSYSPIWTLQDEKVHPYCITEPTLRKEVLIAVQKLEQYIVNQDENIS